MADNLTVTIGIDTAKLRADAAIAKEELRKVNQEVTRAARAGDVAGVRASAAEQDKLVRSIGAINQQLRANTVLKEQNTVATKEATASARKYGLELGHLAHAAGLPIEGLRALRAGFGAFLGVELVRFAGEAIKKMNELGIAAKSAGTTVGTIKGLQSAFRAAGDDANKATPLLQNFFQAVRASRLRDADIARSAAEAYAQVRATPGSSEAEAREAAETTARRLNIARQYAGPSEDPFAFVGIDPARYARTREGQKQLERDTAAALLTKKTQPGMADEAQIASLKLYSQELEVIEPELQKIAQGGYEFPEPSKAAVENLRQYNQVMGNLADTWERIKEAVGGGVAALALAQTDRSAASAVSETGVPYDPTARASGGYIRGPGTGTSDSIWARLSNGEYVINAASTRRLGTTFLNGLNSFADGGLVSMPPIRFAAGGLASAAGGERALAVFNFESGQSFRLGGSVDIVTSMVKAANEQQMRSAGSKPSWYAGRPGGR